MNAATRNTQGRLKVTQLRSTYGQIHSIAASVRGLGLRRIRHSVVVSDTREIRGMIETAKHLLKVEAASAAGGKRTSGEAGQRTI